MYWIHGVIVCSLRAGLRCYIPYSRPQYPGRLQTWTKCAIDQLPWSWRHHYTVRRASIKRRQYHMWGLYRASYFTITYNGHEEIDALPNINDWREQWAIRNGCQSENSNVTFPFANTSMNEWNCSTTDPAAIIRAYTVSGLGHSWPGTLGNDGGKTTFNATTEAILPFFNNHTM